MDNFKSKVEKSKREVRTVIAIIVLVPVAALLAAGYFHYQTEDRIVEGYLEQERPEVMAAIEAYKADNGRYPDSITNAVPRYYKGPQDRVFFLKRYEYRNFGTNFFLKEFNPSR